MIKKPESKLANMVSKHFIFSAGIFLLATMMFVSCKSTESGEEASEDINIEDFITEDEIFDDIEKTKKIFYSLPSPLETAMIIKSAGASYNEELLNDVTNTTKYNTSKSIALNLGVYTTDLSFASLFDQTQTSINYMSAAREMAEGLDISDAIDNETIKSLENNLDKRDVVMDIISETFLNSSAYLKDNDRKDVAAIVLVGGWIEGLFIASELVGENEVQNNELVDRILEQKLSFNILQRLLEDNLNTDGEVNEDISQLIADLTPLKSAFDNVNVETTEAEVAKVASGESGSSESEEVNVIKSKTIVSVETEDFKTLQKAVKELRTSFIQ